jgi:hypothetical protein
MTMVNTQSARHLGSPARAINTGLKYELSVVLGITFGCLSIEGLCFLLTLNA